MRTLEQILENVESKKREMMKTDMEYYGVNNLEQARRRDDPIRGYNKPFDQHEITEHLTDGEFRLWFINKQRISWKEIKEAGVEEIRCLDCSDIIEKPEDMMRLAGFVYHGKCFINSLKTGKYGLKPTPYYERIRRVIFGG